MKIKLVLDDNLFVVDAEAKTENSPYSICKNANSNFKKIIGLQIKSGWKREITKLIGGTNGCTHITELLSSAATAAFQTIYPYKSKQKNRNETNINHSQEKPLLDYAPWAGLGSAVKNARFLTKPSDWQQRN